MVEAPSEPVIRVTNTSATPWSGGRWRIAPGEQITAPWEFLTFFPNAPGLDIDLSDAREHLAVRDRQGRLMLDFWLPLSSVDGYGRHALDIFKGLRKLGAAPFLRDTGWTDHLKPTQYVEEALANRNRLPLRIGLCMSVPYDVSLTKHASAFKIVISQFETDHIPPAHVKAVEKADHLIVTSSFQPPIWRASGLRRSMPLDVMVPGVDTDWFAHRRPERDGKFRCLILGALSGRKNVPDTIRMFQAASDGDPDWRLTIKTRLHPHVQDAMRMLKIPFRVTLQKDADGRNLLDLRLPFRAVATTDPRIELRIADDPPEVVRDLYQSYDCLLWPSKGEGVGLPPLEAMSCGMEVVIADNSGMSDYVRPDHCWPIPTERMEPADGPGGFSREYVKNFGDVGNWWVPSLSEGVKQLRRAHAAWKKGHGKGEAAAEYVRAHHTIDHQARSVLRVLEQYA